MKFQFDLLPKEYKSFSKDTIGKVLAVAALIVSVTCIYTVYSKTYSELCSIQKQVDEADSALRAKVEQISKTQAPSGEIEELKKVISFINSNLDTPGTSLVDFFASLEKAVPDKLVIRDLSPKKMSTLTTESFTINGEAASEKQVFEFVKRLEQSGKFTPVLKDNRQKGQSGTQEFSLKFGYKPK